MTDSKDYSKIFQERLISTRNLRKMTQEELGLKSNMASSHIAHFESGSRKPSFDSICKLADGLSVSVDYLIGRSNKPESFYLAFKFEDYTDTLDKNDIDLLEYQIKEILKKKDDLIKLRIVKKPLDYSDILNIIKKINQLSTEDYLESLHNLKIHILNAGINPEIAIKNSSLYDSIYFLMSILNMLIFDLYHNPQDITLTNGIIKLFLESGSMTEFKTKFISIMKKADNEQDKVLVIETDREREKEREKETFLIQARYRAQQVFIRRRSATSLVCSYGVARIYSTVTLTVSHSHEPTGSEIVTLTTYHTHWSSSSAQKWGWDIITWGSSSMSSITCPALAPSREREREGAVALRVVWPRARRDSVAWVSYRRRNRPMLQIKRRYSAAS